MTGHFQELQHYYDSHQERLLSLQKVNRLLTYRHNLQKIIEQMKYFMGMKKKIEKIRTLLSKDDLGDYEYINYKLMRLMVLKSSLGGNENDFQQLRLSNMLSMTGSMEASGFSKEDPLQQDLAEL